MKIWENPVFMKMWLDVGGCDQVFIIVRKLSYAECNKIASENNDLFIHYVIDNALVKVKRNSYIDKRLDSVTGQVINGVKMIDKWTFESILMSF